MIKKQNNIKIAFQGMMGAYSDMACTECFPKGETLPCTSFEEMMEITKKGITDYAMVPVENSLAGDCISNSLFNCGNSFPPSFNFF